MQEDKSKTTNIHAGHRARMREKLQKGGPDALADHEFLEMMLYYVHTRKNTNDEAHRLIDEFGSLPNVIDAEYDDLIKIDGIGDTTAGFITFIHDLMSRYYKQKFTDSVVLDSPDKIGDYITAHYLTVTHEEFAILTFNSRFGFINFHTIEKGSPDKVSINIRRIVDFCVRDNAANLVICHNHPGGIAMPSNADIDVTIKIVDTLKGLGLRVLDHIIAAGNDYISMAASRQYKYIFK